MHNGGTALCPNLNMRSWYQQGMQISLRKYIELLLCHKPFVFKPNIFWNLKNVTQTVYVPFIEPKLTLKLILTE